MVSRTVKVTNEEGLHGRPATTLVKAVKSCKDCEITLKYNGKTVKAGSVMQLMAACIKKGAEVEVVVNGANEQTVLDELTAMFENNFGE